MAKPGISALVASLPPPGKLGRNRPAEPEDGAEPDGDEGEYDDGDDQKAAETAAADRVAQALGIKGVDTEELCEALKDFLSTIKE
jgi:hypothetical protein